MIHADNCLFDNLKTGEQNGVHERLEHRRLDKRSIAELVRQV
jgi:hypothetical protein